MTATEDQTRVEHVEAALASLSQRLNRVIRAQEDLQEKLAAVLRLLTVAGDAEYPEALTSRRFRIASQNEEDGITYALLREIGVPLRRFVEIGAGTNGGNSGFLATELGFEGLMVDASEGELAVLQRTIPPGRVRFAAAWVTVENVNGLITENGLEGEIDLFSLDIDGNDYWVWKALEACNPRIVIVEYNSLFGPERRVTVPYDPEFSRLGQVEQLKGGYYGASLGALASLADSKGYRLVAVEPQGVNAYFLRSDLTPGISAVDPATAYRVNRSHRKLFSKGFDVYAAAERADVELVEV